MWTRSWVILFYMQGFNTKMVFWLLQNIQSYRGWQHCWKPCHNTHRLPFKCLYTGENGRKIQLYEFFFCWMSVFIVQHRLQPPLHLLPSFSFASIMSFLLICFYVLYSADVLIHAIILYCCTLPWLTWSVEMVVYTFSTCEGTVYQLQFNIYICTSTILYLALIILYSQTH